MKNSKPVQEVGRLLGMIHNGIHRMGDNDPMVRELEGMTGKNLWIIGYLNCHKDQPIYQKDLEKAFNVTRERVRQIESKALRRLRHPSKSKILRDFVN